MDDVQIARPGADIAVVALHGEHDLTTKEQFASLLATEITDNELVVVDVSDADFIDTSILHNLLRADQLARAGGTRFVLQMGTARIVRLAIENSGVLDSLTWVGSREEALQRDKRTRSFTPRSGSSMIAG
ncbi:MAG: STAS domain-containing protein [Aeromicrobium sp.]